MIAKAPILIVYVRHVIRERILASYLASILVMNKRKAQRFYYFAFHVQPPSIARTGIIEINDLGVCESVYGQGSPFK